MDNLDLEKVINKVIGNKEKIFKGVLEKIREDEFNNKITVLSLMLLNRKDNDGLSIVNEIDILLKNKLKNKEGVIYPILHGLEEKKYITSYWEKDNIDRKYYRINKLGRNYLKEKSEIVSYLKGENEFICGEEFSWS